MKRFNGIYPKNAIQFYNWYMADFNRFVVYNKLGCPKPFDVSLRDGLQGLNKQQQDFYSFINKLNLYHKIIKNYLPNKIEIGSLVSPKFYPIFSDTLELLEHIKKSNLHINEPIIADMYVLIPNEKQLMKTLMFHEDYGFFSNSIQNFSFITSISDSFQLRNTKMNLIDSKRDLHNMIGLLSGFGSETYNVKLYISCINECPIEGRFEPQYTIDKILEFKQLQRENLKFNNICLSDTLGTLKFNDFKIILDGLLKYILPTNLSLHLHIKDINEIEKIMFYALSKNVSQFDVSLLETGGCSMTIKETNHILYPNLYYNLYYQILTDYIYNETETNNKNNVYYKIKLDRTIYNKWINYHNFI